MKPVKLLFACIFVMLNLTAYCWRIEGNILFIEKGDNLSQIAHSLYANGHDQQRLWKLCIDKAISNNPNILLQDMRFRLDTSIIKITDTIKIYGPSTATSPLFILKDDEGFDWSAFLAALLGLIAALGAARLQYEWTKKNGQNEYKRNSTFEFHREFHSEGIHAHRVAGNKLVIRNQKLQKTIFDDFEKLSMSNEAGTNSIFVVFNFYNRLWVAVDNKQMDDKLVPKLFGDIFFYWYDFCFGLGIEGKAKEDAGLQNPEVWQSYKNIIKLKQWLEPRMTTTTTPGNNEKKLTCRIVNDNYLDQEIKKAAAPAAASTAYTVEIKSDELKTRIVDELEPKLNTTLEAKIIAELEKKYELKKKEI